MTCVRAAVLVTTLLAGAASAHDADVIYVSARSDEAGAISEVITLTFATLALLAPIDADGDRELTQADLDARTTALQVGVWDQVPLSAGGQRCPRSRETATLREGYVELTASFACAPGELRQDFRILSVIPTNYRVVLGSQVDGERGKAFAQGTFSTLTIARPPPPRAWSSERFVRAAQDGLVRAVSLDALAFLLLVSLTALTVKRSVASGVVALVGLALGSLTSLPEPFPAIGLVIASFGLALWSPSVTDHAATALGAVALGLRSGGGDPSTVAGLIAGSVCVLVVITVASAIVSRRLRGSALATVRLGLAGVALVALGVRCAALLLG